MKNLLRRIGALAAAVMMCFALTVPALAEEISEGSITIKSAYRDSEGWSSASSISVESGSSSSTYGYLDLTGNGTQKGISYLLLDLNANTAFKGNGSHVLYFSFAYYPKTASNALLSSIPTSSNFSFITTDGDTGVREKTPVTISTWESSDYIGGVGVSLSARYSVSAASPLGRYAYLYFNDGDSNVIPSFYCYRADDSNFGTTDPRVKVFGIRVVSSDSDATLDGLENIADSIAAQNSMLSAYYGDIVEICNQIYQRLGDMQQTQIEANELLSSLVSLLNSTNGKISALNQAMSTYFELVLKSLENESLSIQDCINDAELRLETYLKPIVDYFTELEETTGESASSLPGHKTDLDKWSSDSTGIDDDAQTGLAAVLPVLSAFSFIFQIVGIFIGLGIFRVIIKKGVS